MPNTFELIASSTVGAGGAADITFSSIANNWTDLVLKVSARATINETGISLQFNGNTSTSNYSYRTLQGNGASASSSSETSLGFIGGRVNPSTYTASTFNNYEMYIPNYAGSNQKSISSDTLNENNATTANIMLVAGLWNQTSAITSIKLYIVGGNLAQYSSAYLYGVKNA